MSRGKIVGDGPTGQYKIGAVLGKGAFSTVYDCVRLCDGAVFAVKVISKLDMRRDPDLEDALCREINSMEAIRHSQFITNMIDKLVSPRNYYIVMDRASGGSLQQLLQKHSSGLHPNRARLYFRQLLLGLGAIHRSNVVHRDIKLENLLLDASKTNLKVSDFGFACYSGPERELRRKCGTTRYTAPELHLQETYFGRDVDIWAAGVSLYVMLFNCYPFGARQDDTQTVIEKICRGKLTFPRRTSSSLEHLLRVILRVNPKKRWKLEQIKSHAWVMGIDEVTITLPKVLLVTSPLDTQQGVSSHTGEGAVVNRRSSESVGTTPPSSCGSGTPKPSMVAAAAQMRQQNLQPSHQQQQQQTPFPPMGASPNSGMGSCAGSITLASSPNDEPDSRYLLHSSLLEDPLVEAMEPHEEDDEEYLTGGSHRRVRSCPVLPTIFFESCNGTCSTQSITTGGGGAEERYHQRFLSTADASALAVGSSVAPTEPSADAVPPHPRHPGDDAMPHTPTAATSTDRPPKGEEHCGDSLLPQPQPTNHPHHEHHHHHHHLVSSEHQRWQVKKALWLSDLHTKPSALNNSSSTLSTEVPAFAPPPVPTAALQLHSFAAGVGGGGVLGSNVGLATSSSAVQQHSHFARDDAFFTDMPSSQRRRGAGLSAPVGVPSAVVGSAATASPAVNLHGRRDVPLLRLMRRSPPTAASTTPYRDRSSGSPTSSSPLARWDRSSSTPPHGNPSSNNKDGTPQSMGSSTTNAGVASDGHGQRFVRNSLWRRLSMVHVKIFVNFCVFCTVLLAVGALRVLFDVDARKLPIPSFLRDIMERVLAPPFERDGDSLGTATAAAVQRNGNGKSGTADVPTLAAPPAALSRTTGGGGGRDGSRTNGGGKSGDAQTPGISSPQRPTVVAAGAGGGGTTTTLRRRRLVDPDDDSLQSVTAVRLELRSPRQTEAATLPSSADVGGSPSADVLPVSDGTPSKRRVRITTPSSAQAPSGIVEFSEGVRPSDIDPTGAQTAVKDTSGNEAERRNAGTNADEEKDDHDEARCDSPRNPCPGTSGMRQVVSHQTFDDLADLEDELI